MIAEELGPWVEQYGWDPGSDAFEKLDVLMGLWTRYGAAMNLHGAKTRAELLLQVQDGLETALCARRAVEISSKTRWLDVGSGGGFPILVVAATLGCACTALEPRHRRSAFLELGFRTIESSSSRVLCDRLDPSTWNEKRVTEGVGLPEIATARAVWKPAGWLKVGSDVVGSEGVVLVHSKDPPISGHHVITEVAGTLGQITAYCST